ncbi:hypothetical protein Q1695_002564 [Nippostrongylus brasiliensis]|nr:hypothetical protein Q1695_002564 [Nippostrongylus brasiliensis]
MKKLRNRDLLDQFLGTKGNDGRAQSDPGTNTSTSNGLFYCAIRNIPSSMRSKDLRRYFSDFVENGKFHCFHFRHRPELQQESSAGTQKCTSGSQNPKTSTTCCVISFATQELRQVIMILRIILSEFIREYHGRHWMNNEGMEIPRRCFVNALKCTESSEGSSDSVTAADLREMIELKPPALMPHGNVGTPTEYFFEQIRLCRLPVSLIPKLGLQTTRRRRKYESVRFNYATRTSEHRGQLHETIAKSCPDDSVRRDTAETSMQEELQSISDLRPKSDPTDQILQTQFGPDNDAGADDDDDQCEEWERHEALHDDVTEQDRIKPRKYEEEMEVVWEKGGPGLVWFTDKNYWDEREKGTDCDWAWADDWDVDYSVYYEGKSAGSKDARDAVEIREDDAKRTGKLEESVFTKKSASSHARRKRRNSDTEITNIEQYSKGIGSKLLGRMGWKPGSGLGRTQQGRVDPVAIHLEEDGQSGIEKKGFGYRGEKMMRTGFAKVQKVHAITSCFDEVTDKTVTPYKRVGNEASGEILFRRSELTKMKYRSNAEQVSKK